MQLLICMYVPRLVAFNAALSNVTLPLTFQSEEAAPLASMESTGFPSMTAATTAEDDDDKDHDEGEKEDKEE